MADQMLNTLANLCTVSNAAFSRQKRANPAVSNEVNDHEHSPMRHPRSEVLEKYSKDRDTAVTMSGSTS